MKRTTPFGESIAVLFTVLLIVGMAAVDYRRPASTQEDPQNWLAGIGTRDHPTTDLALMKTVLDQIAGIPPFPGPGWVHLVSTGYMTPPRIPHPLHPRTGFQTVEQWIYVNTEGFGVKNLITIRDQDGRITQQSACAAEVCGNISKAALAEFANEKLAIPFTPFPFTVNSASSLIQEVFASNAWVKAWVEPGPDGPVFFIDSLRSNRNNPVLREVSPEFEGSRIVMGIEPTSGVMVYFSLHKIIRGQAILEYEERLTTYEILETQPEVDRRIADIVAALKARDGIE